ncbi:MAG TPA: hypothetical protein VN672_09990 [Solirubrobacteraceae bacterium]|nr:hypothetical protein [Solirubrobacteraceae bacterium]
MQQTATPIAWMVRPVDNQAIGLARRDIDQSGRRIGVCDGCARVDLKRSVSARAITVAIEAGAGGYARVDVRARSKRQVGGSAATAARAGELKDA